MPLNSRNSVACVWWAGGRKDGRSGEVSEREEQYRYSVSLSYLSVTEALQKQEVWEVQRRVNGILCGAVIAALRLLPFISRTLCCFVALGLWILLLRSLRTGALSFSCQIRVTETLKQIVSAVHGIITHAYVQRHGFPSGARLLQLTCLCVYTWRRC